MPRFIDISGSVPIAAAVEARAAIDAAKEATLVAPAPTGNRVTDTAALQALVDEAQETRGTVVLQAGTYAADIVTERGVGILPRIVGQGKQYTSIDGTIKVCGVSASFLGGASGAYSGGYLSGFSMVGTHASDAALEFNGCIDVHWSELRIQGTYAVGVLFHNELASDYTELCNGSIDIGKFVTTAVEYRITSGSRSFHGSGLVGESQIQSSDDGPTVLIGTNARPYNCPMSVRVWFQSDTYPLFSHGGDPKTQFYGNLVIEGGGFTGSGETTTDVLLASGSNLFYTGTINSLFGGTPDGDLDYGTLRHVPSAKSRNNQVFIGDMTVNGFLGGSGNRVLTLEDRPTGANHLKIAAESSRPSITPVGPAESIGILLNPKGPNGDVNIYRGVTGERATVSATGVDTDYDIYLSPKGAGAIKHGNSAASSPGWYSGTGTPEGAVTAPPGSYYSNKSGGAGTTLYVKQTGTGNTGWVASATATSPDIQVFTTVGTWTKPAGATSVHVRCIGAGGGGGAGARGPSGTALAGGGGGGAGGMSEMTFAASDLTSTVSVGVYSGGAGATGQTSNDTAGANGSPGGGGTTFGAYLSASRSATGGTGGGLAAGGGGGSLAGGMFNSVAGGAGSTSGAAGATPSSVTAPGSGGGGGGITTGGTANAGGAGGAPNTTTLAGGTAGSGANGGNGNSSAVKGPGTGGGGGGANAAGAGYNGGNAGAYGAGGGGGGASLNGSTSGAGGNGGDGICIVTTYF